MFSRILALMLALSACEAQTLITVCASGCTYNLSQLQNAIDAATCGDIIQIAAGATATTSGGSPLMLRYKSSCAANGPYITIRSSGVTNLTSGARVTPADAANLAKITIATGPWAVLSNEQGAAYYRFHGIEFTAPATFFGDLIEFGTRTPVLSYVADNEVSDLAHHIVFDQCYFHGDPASTDGPRRAIRANLGHMEVLNSWFENIKNQNGESNAIGGWNAKGPFYIRNNHLEAVGITTLFGGAEPTMKGLRANGLFFTGNHYYRPWKYRVRYGTVNPTWDCLWDANGGEYYNNTSNSTYWRCDSGTWTSILVGAMSPYFWQKNIFELKNAWRSWVEGNHFENAWQPAAQNQFGTMFLFNLVDNDPPGGTAEPAATVGYVQIRNNYGRRTPWVASLGSIGSTYYRWHNNIEFSNNVFDEIGDSPFTLAAAETNGSKWGGSFITMPYNGDKISYLHNTVVSRNPVEARMGYLYGSIATTQITGGTITGNVTGWNKYGLYNDVTGGNLWNSVAEALAPGRNVFRNVVVNNESQTYVVRPYPLVNLGINLDTPSDLTSAACNGSTLELNGAGTANNGNCAFPAAWTDIFSNYSTKDYSMAAYTRWGPMGRTPGANTSVVGWATSGVNSDNATSPAYQDFQPVVRAYQTSLLFRYVAPSTSACTLTVSAKPDLSSPVINAGSDGGGDPSRTVDSNSFAGLSSNTRYYWRITCSGKYREDIATTLP